MWSYIRIKLDIIDTLRPSWNCSNCISLRHHMSHYICNSTRANDIYNGLPFRGRPGRRLKGYRKTMFPDVHVCEEWSDW